MAQVEDDERAVPTRRSDGLVPVPDPTLLTTQAVDRAIRDFKELMESKGEVVATRLNGIDQATKLVAADVARIAAGSSAQEAQLRQDTDRAIAALREFLTAYVDRLADVSSEKFAGIAAQIADRDDRVKQTAADGDVKLNAALASQEKLFAQQNTANAAASAKQEASFQKQSDQERASNAALYGSLNEKIAALTSRLDKLPGEQAATTKTDKRSDTNTMISIVVLAVAILAFVVGRFIG